MTLEEVTGKNYVSHSALNTWLSCGWQFYLSRIQRVPEQPSYWLAGGKAVHESTELYDRLYYGTEKESTFSSTDAFVEAWHRNYTSAENGMEWRASGRATKLNPNKEDTTWWLENGPKMVDFWTQFRQDSNFNMYKLPDGTDAIETELNETVGGVPIKAFLDRLMVAPTGELLVVDIKTSSREPASLTQLGIYAILVEKAFGIRPTHGSYYMARTGELTAPQSLDRFTEARLGSWAKGFEIAIENKIFIPSPSTMCGTCSVNRACYSYGGNESHLYPEITIGENK
jgi:CRISPR/Cas system-associated exonuclease Cas4 (RecB family)